MITVKFPKYMINNRDEIQKDGTYIIIKVEYKEKIAEILDEISSIFPYTVKDWLDKERQFKKNFIVIQNDKILDKKKIDEYILLDGDILEILTQFAGG